ncbi:hypothetical protein [Hymenobacter sp. BT491]|uniref:hypothetical protein n=1 Tax=Hymenobacter sp. BT491 TaxID=2766779 RepID=UPI001653988F|nr:hypothetical protein [Hymenobacter sp. BT491]MBC6989302.1 hypothetical protein [Hymenobacter sp. BT491]
MKNALWLLCLALLSASCGHQPQVLHEKGILVLDNARNCMSYDYFIPCDINDTISLGKNVESVNSHTARHISAGQLQFALLDASWPSSADSFYVRGHQARRKYLSAVELTLKRVDDMSVDTVQRINPQRLAGTITINQFYPGYYRITHAKKIILLE